MRKEYIRTLERQTTPPYDTPLVATEYPGWRYKVKVDGVDKFVSWPTLMEIKNARNPDPKLPDLIIVDLTDAETGTT